MPRRMSRSCKTSNLMEPDVLQSRAPPTIRYNTEQDWDNVDHCHAERDEKKCPTVVESRVGVGRRRSGDYGTRDSCQRRRRPTESGLAGQQWKRSCLLLLPEVAPSGYFSLVRSFRIPPGIFVEGFRCRCRTTPEDTCRRRGGASGSRSHCKAVCSWCRSSLC